MNEFSLSHGEEELEAGIIVALRRSMTSIPPGRYVHYKGHEYTVIGTARHSETEEELVVYRQEYGDRSLWVRPRKMFGEMVEVEGRPVPRFRYVGEDE